MNREELSEAIHDLARTPHMAEYALEHAMALLSLHQLGELFDTVADHDDLVGKMAGLLARGTDVDLSRSTWHSDALSAMDARGESFCDREHFDGRGPHVLGRGEVCAFAKF